MREGIVKGFAKIKKMLKKRKKLESIKEIENSIKKIKIIQEVI